MSTYDDASLIYYPSGYKAGTAYSLKPTDGSGDLDFTRASTATRVNEQGLIEGVRTNSLLYSEQFDNAAWIKSTGTLVTPNAALSPSGLNDADLVYGTNFNISQNISLPLGTYTFSVYLKATGINIGKQIGIRFQNSPFPQTTLITNGEWQRLSVTITIAATTTLSPRILLFGVTNPVSEILAWGAQLELSASVTEYIPTTTTAVSVGMLANVPRIDYTGGGCGKLLLEPQRTNVITQSQSFADYYVNRATATDLGTPSIFSSGSIARFTATTADARFGKIIGSVTSGSTYTVSGFFDLSEGIYAGVSDGSNYRVFNLLTASVVGSGNGTLTISCKSTQVGSLNYYRVSFTFTATTTGNHFFIIGKSDGTNNTTNEKVAAGYFQREDSASYATSYIPTTTTAVTRVSDIAGKSGISSLIGQTEGVVFYDFIWQTTGQANQSSSVNSGSYYNSISFGHYGGALRLEIYYNGTPISLGSQVLITGQRYKIAFAYKSGDSATYVNGVQLSTSSTSFAFASALNNLFLTYNGENFGDKVNTYMLFKTRLSNAELATLTTI